MIQWIVVLITKTWITNAIKHEYDTKLEKISNIATFFASWVKYRGNEHKWLTEKERIDYFENLTKMSFELTLWVDDESFLRDVMKRLRNEDSSVTIQDLLVKAKVLISENNNTCLKAEDLTLWPADTSFIHDGPK